MAFFYKFSSLNSVTNSGLKHSFCNTLINKIRRFVHSVVC